MDWNEIMQIDRRLKVFDRELSRFKDEFEEEADYGLYEVFKKWGSEHVGWQAELPELRTPEAYNVMIRHISEVLGN